MSLGAFKLPLAPPETLGRRFQYALLSLAPHLAMVDHVAGYAVFNSPSDYAELVATALEAIKALVVPGGRQRGCTPLQVRGVDCCSLHRGPSLYAAGRRGRVGGQSFVGDYLTLAQAGFTGCPYTTAKGKATTAWAHAAVSYADLVLERGGPLNGRAPDLPWLAKVTVFGKLRATGGGRSPSALGGATLDTLGSILLGGTVSFLWSERVGDSLIEFYLVPDSVHEGFRDLRALMLRGGAAGGTVARAARLARDYPVSVDVAIALALAEDLADAYGPASQLSAYTSAVNLEKAAVIATVTPQQRPMMRSATPLSVALYLAYSEASLRGVSRVARLAARPSIQKSLPGIRDLVGRCISSMYLQALSGRWSDHLSACIRDLYTASDQARRAGEASLSAELERLAASLSRDYASLR